MQYPIKISSLNTAGDVDSMFIAVQKQPTALGNLELAHLGGHLAVNFDCVIIVISRIKSLLQVVACYRHLASCVGGSTDSLQLRDQLRQTRQKALKLAEAICHHLTSHLRDKTLPQDQRKEMELLWVAFTSSLELLHVDMCKVLNIGDTFSLSKTASLVQTGLQGR